MKKIGSLIILIIVAGGLYATNPNKAAFAEYIKQQAAGNPEKSDTLQSIFSQVIGTTAKLDAEAHTSRENYFVCSVFHYEGVLTEMEGVKYIGFLNQFIKLN